MNWKRIKNLLSWVVSTAAPLVLMAFSARTESQLPVKEAIAEVDHHSGMNFVLDEDVLQKLAESNPNWQGNPVAGINIQLLEERLEELNGTQKAEVFFQLNGKVYLHVTQRQPLLRIFDKKKSYYLDNQGNAIRLSDNFAAKVPIVTGIKDSADRAAVVHLFSSIRNEEFLKDIIAGGGKDENGEFFLIPSFGNHRVHLGSLDNCEKKLKKLSAFYRFGLGEENRNRLVLVNLKYANQVVCTNL